MGVYAVEMLFEEPPSISRLDFLAAVRRFAPTAELLGGDAPEGTLAILQPEYSVSYAEGKSLPAQVAFFPTTKAPDVKTFESALQQSWGFVGAAEAVHKATSCALITDLMAGPLEPWQRLSAFQKVLDGALHLLQPVALYWQAADCVVDPASYRREIPRDYPDPFSGAINVRLFRVEGSEEGDTIMDTRGLDVFGLPDLQCHFRGLDPKAVASMLYNTAAYVLEHGDVIEDGHTVAGLSSTDRWQCQHEESLAAPERTVLDINPGKPFAAGR
jgi:hypothetical protein